MFIPPPEGKRVEMEEEREGGGIEEGRKRGGEGKIKGERREF